MGFYLHKGFNFRPLRLNLSRSRLGASFGVKGARIGVGPRGSYIHMGRGGLYYRQTLTLPKGSQYRRRSPAPQHVPSTDGLQEITSKDATSMADSSAADLLKELNRVKDRTARFPITFGVGLVMTCWFGIAGFNVWLLVATLVAATVLSLCARHSDVTNGTAVLNYSLEGEAAQEFEKLQAFRHLAGCELVWHVDAAGRARCEAECWRNYEFASDRDSSSFLMSAESSVQYPSSYAQSGAHNHCTSFQIGCLSTIPKESEPPLIAI